MEPFCRQFITSIFFWYVVGFVETEYFFDFYRPSEEAILVNFWSFTFRWRRCLQCNSKSTSTMVNFILQYKDNKPREYLCKLNTKIPNGKTWSSNGSIANINNNRNRDNRCLWRQKQITWNFANTLQFLLKSDLWKIHRICLEQERHSVRNFTKFVSSNNFDSTVRVFNNSFTPLIIWKKRLKTFIIG